MCLVVQWFKGPVYRISLAARMSIILSHSEVLLGQTHRNLNCVAMHIFGFCTPKICIETQFKFLWFWPLGKLPLGNPIYWSFKMSFIRRPISLTARHKCRPFTMLKNALPRGTQILDSLLRKKSHNSPWVSNVPPVIQWINIPTLDIGLIYNVFDLCMQSQKLKKL